MCHVEDGNSYRRENRNVPIPYFSHQRRIRLTTPSRDTLMAQMRAIQPRRRNSGAPFQW